MQPAIQPPIDYACLFPQLMTLFARHGRPRLFIHAIGAGIGDDLLCTAVLRALRERSEPGPWLATHNPTLFRGNPDLGVLVPPLRRLDVALARAGVRVVVPFYTDYDPLFDRDEPAPEQHIISMMCQRAGITGEVALRPFLHLSPEERAGGQYGERQLAVQSSGMDARHAMSNKNWVTSRYQEVVDALRDRCTIVQIGSARDPALEGTVDLRGRTSLRESAAVLAASQVFVGQAGFLMHLARAVECRSVIVYGGRELPSITGYPCNENLYTAPPCSPCWHLNSCGFGRACLTAIPADDVIAAVDRQLARVGAALECDHVSITAEMIEGNARRRAEAEARHRLAWELLYR